MNELIYHWLWRRSIILHRGPVEAHGVGVSLPGGLREGRRRGLEMERLPIWEHCGRNLEGGLLYWEP